MICDSMNTHMWFNTHLSIDSDVLFTPTWVNPLLAKMAQLYPTQRQQNLLSYKPDNTGSQCYHDHH